MHCRAKNTSHGTNVALLPRAVLHWQRNTEVINVRKRVGLQMYAALGILCLDLISVKLVRQQLVAA